MPSRVRVATPDEEKAFEAAGGGGMVARVATPEEEKAFDATGEAGAPGHDPYKDGPNAHIPTAPEMRTGDWKDGLKNAVNVMTLGLAPKIEGAIAAGMAPPGQQLDAYRSVRDEGEREHASSANTLAGKAVTPLATLLTPVPVKALPKGASIEAKAWQGAKVGGGANFVEGAANSKGDLTKMDSENWKRVLGDAFVRGAFGAGGGAAAGALLSPAERATSSVAETQALRAAGLRGGIKNSIKKDLGLSNMDEARELGRQFLDEGLIPPIGSSEAVAKRAEKLQGQAGNAKSAVLNEADVSGTKFDYSDGADAARRMLDGETAVATELSGQKAHSFADAFEKQGTKTPGSFVGADKAKSDAWRSARFDNDAPMSAVLYRKAVGAARDDIERQVAAALGGEKAAALNAANKKYGIGADAVKLAENASTRDAAKKGFGMPEILAMTTGAGAAGGGAAGHPLAGGAAGLALALGAKGFDKFGHSTAARFSDFLAKQAAKNSGGVVGAKGADELAEYLGLLNEKDNE